MLGILVILLGHTSLLRNITRNMFIQVRETPNPNSLMFLPGCKVLGSGTVHFHSPGEGKTSPLARSLFRIEGVKEILLAGDFVTIVKVRRE